MKKLLLLLSLSALLLSLIACGKQSADELTVTVKVSGEVIARLPLSEDTELTIEGVGGTNLLVIKDGAAWVTSADCKNQICVNTGKIDGTSMLGMITCLPHEVVIYLEKR